MIRVDMLLVALLVLIQSSESLFANSAMQEGVGESANLVDQKMSFRVHGRACREDGETQNITIDVIYSQPGQEPESDKDAGLPSLTIGEELRRETLTTDPDGRYMIEVPATFDNDSGTMVTVEISCPGFLTRQIGPYNVQALDASRAEPKTLAWKTQIERALKQTSLRAGILLRGRVLLPNGSPAAGAVVWSSARPAPYSWKFPDPDRYASQTTTTTDGDGKFEILVDRMANMSITADGLAPLLIGRLEDFDGTTDFRLPTPIRPHGKIVDQHGDPVAFAIVYVRPNLKYNENSLPPLFVLSTVSDEYGNFAFSPLPPGSYLFQTRHQIADRMQAKSIDLDIDDSWQKLETEPLEQIFLTSYHEFSPEQGSPEVLLQASVTHQIEVDVRLPESPAPPTKLGASGYVGDVYWIGESVHVSESGKVSIEVPHGLERVKLFTGIAYLQSGEDSKKKINHLFQIARVEEDLSGYIVTVPRLARLKVRTEHADFRVLSSSRIDVVYARDGLPDDHVVTAGMVEHMTRLSGPTTISGRAKVFSCAAIADQKVVVVIRNESGEILHQKIITLGPGEERELAFDLNRPDD